MQFSIDVINLTHFILIYIYMMSRFVIAFDASVIRNLNKSIKFHLHVELLHNSAKLRARRDVKPNTSWAYAVRPFVDLPTRKPPKDSKDKKKE